MTICVSAKLQAALAVPELKEPNKAGTAEPQLLTILCDAQGCVYLHVKTCPQHGATSRAALL